MSEENLEMAPSPNAYACGGCHKVLNWDPASRSWKHAEDNSDMCESAEGVIITT